MYTFLIGIVILCVGGALYSRFCVKVFEPDDRPTPAIARNDGVAFVPMKKWRNSLIELLNIAGTGPVLGPIQGILFGPIAFILIPIGCVFGGAVHDYFCGMMSMRHGGRQMPSLMKGFMSRPTYHLFNFAICLLLFLIGVVFIYTPGDMVTASILDRPTDFIDADGGFAGIETLAPLIIVYAIILCYYLLATLFPIDKIIGCIYPIFGAILLLSALGILIALFTTGDILALDELFGPWSSWVSIDDLIPMFFVTVTCGIVSGFHNSQACLIARSVPFERDGRTTFFMMMIAEGFIAMIWAAATMGIYNTGAAVPGADDPIAIVGIISRNFLGDSGGVIAILGTVVLAITSGDTALRSLRLMLADYFHIDQDTSAKRLRVALAIFVPLAIVLVFAKIDPLGFNNLWRYFSFANELCAVFAFSLISVYLSGRRKPWPIAFVPGCFYMYVVSDYLMIARIGFNLDPLPAYIVSAVITILYAVILARAGFKRRAKIASGEIDPMETETPQA